MNLTDVRAFALRGAATREALWGGTITLEGTDYSATVGTPPIEGAYEAGGEILTGQLIIVIRKAILAECPARETRLTAKGKDWIIKRTSGDDPTSVDWTLYCDPPN